jgi:uncharacterized protein YdaU (DUF1376 family)
VSFAFMPFYTGDYQRDTRHLTPEEHGIYILLLVYCWDQKAPIPLDERRQCGIVNARSGGEIESLRRVLSEFFIRLDDGWYNKRMSEEIAKAEHISSDRRRGGLEKARRMRDAVRGAQAQQEHSKSNALAGTPTPTLTTTPTTIKREEARATRFALSSLPEDWRSYCRTKRSDLNADLVFESFSDYWQSKPGKDGRKLDWFATWRLWVRNEKAGRSGGATADEVAALVRELEGKE